MWFTKHSDTLWLALNPSIAGKRFKPCYNYQHHQVCNWVIPAESSEIYCESAYLHIPFPSLDNPDHLVYWARLEHAKRRFFIFNATFKYYAYALNDPIVIAFVSDLIF